MAISIYLHSIQDNSADLCISSALHNAMDGSILWQVSYTEDAKDSKNREDYQKDHSAGHILDIRDLFSLEAYGVAVDKQ